MPENHMYPQEEHRVMTVTFLDHEGCTYESFEIHRHKAEIDLIRFGLRVYMDLFIPIIRTIWNLKWNKG